MKINKKYQIEVIKDKDKTLFIVYATDIYSPSEFFSKIESDLKKKKVGGDVFFDLIIPNGGKKRPLRPYIIQRRAIDKLHIKQSYGNR